LCSENEFTRGGGGQEVKEDKDKFTPTVLDSQKTKQKHEQLVMLQQQQTQLKKGLWGEEILPNVIQVYNNTFL
jgi:hypothetical protein